jgi:hypothetical protein
MSPQVEGCLLHKATLDLHIDTQQALKSSMALLWDYNDENNDDNVSSNNDNDNHLFNSMNPPKKKGHPDASTHFSTAKGTKVTIDATVAKQLMKELLVDPLTYADYDHIPPMTQAQLDFLVSHIGSVVQPPFWTLDEATDTGPEVGDNLNMETKPQQ